MFDLHHHHHHGSFDENHHHHKNHNDDDVENEGSIVELPARAGLFLEFNYRIKTSSCKHHTLMMMIIIIIKNYDIMIMPTESNVCCWLGASI